MALPENSYVAWDFRNISTFRDNIKDTLHAEHSLENYPNYFAPAAGEASWLIKFSLLAIRRYSATRKHLFPVSTWWQGSGMKNPP